ncbi:MAG TPA: M14 family zinc carboxypeptidase [bacterium]|nr:M14 family zinc carboxypeptidase [bacterium]
MGTSSRVALLLVAMAVLAAPVHAGNPEIATVQARIEFRSMDEWNSFLVVPGLDVMKSKRGIGATIITNPDEVAELRDMGFNVIIEIPDLPSHFRSQMPRDDFGDFHNFTEMVAALDALHAAYPSITTDKISLGTTEEGRDLWVMKISDNPDIDEAEPEVLLDGMHHAREPIAMECILHYMTWLCENYGTDPEATYLVDNREVWCFPIVNPDGYVYNESLGWGTMWRKNRRTNAGSPCRGVDNNRNYNWEWGTSGVVHDPCDDLWCGTTYFTEIENQAYRDFVYAHDFPVNISFHSVVGCILVPWGYANIPSPDDALIREVANEMAKYNGYEVGRAGEVINYTCSGTTCDWMYGELGILSVCVEVGGSHFWPQESELPGLVAENLWPQQYMTRIAGSYLAVRDNYTLAGGNGDQNPDPGETLDLTVTIDNQGVLAGATNVAVTLVSDDPYVQLHDAASSLGTIAARDYANNAADPFSFTLDGSTPDGHGLVLKVVITADDFVNEEEIVWMVGTPTLLFSDNMESGTVKWVENDGLWGLTSAQFHSMSSSYTDSPGGGYGNYRNTWIELADPIDFSGAIAAELKFWHAVDTEENYDYCYVEASSDGGATWLQLGEKFHGTWPWAQVSLPLDDFVGTANFKVRFRFTSDSYVTEDGWYIDDVEIYGPPTGNVAPSAPTLSDPPDGGTVVSPMPALTVVNASDPDVGDVLTYGFIVYTDELCTSVAASATGVAEGAGTTSWTVGSALSSGTYYWRAYADDGTERGPLMGTGSFIVNPTGAGTLPRLALRPAQPNPFGAETTLAFEMPVAADVTLAVYSVDGRLVRTLVEGHAGPGPVEVSWDGLDGQGRRVGSGLYFVRLVAGNDVRRGKLVVLR